MNLRAAPERHKLIAAVFAIAVHVLFFALLVIGVSWHKQQPDATVVDLWDRLPAPASKRANVEPERQPVPKPTAKPKPSEKAESKPNTPQPDIAVKEKKEKLRAQEEEKQKRELVKKREQERKLAEAKLRQQQQRELLDKQIQERDKKLAQLLRERERAEGQAQQATASNRADDDIRRRIHDKIQRMIVLPPDIPGNPQAIFRVVLLPGGDLLNVQMIRSSGHAAYDDAVERAIYKAQPLPIPPDPSQFSKFRELELKFRPKSEE